MRKKCVSISKLRFTRKELSEHLYAVDLTFSSHHFSSLKSKQSSLQSLFHGYHQFQNETETLFTK